MTADDRAYGDQLGHVLRQRSVPALRAFLEAQAGRYGGEQQVAAIRAQSDAELETIMHRMTLARADLPELHAESERWLASQGGEGPGTVRGPGSGGGPGPNGVPRPGGNPGSGGGQGNRRPRPGGSQRRRRPPQT